MDGPVEIDDAFFEGFGKNHHADKKGTTSKTAVVCVKDRTTNKVTAKPVPETTKARLDDFVERNVAEDAKKYTDENRTYSDPMNYASVNHSVGEYVRGQAHTNGMESFWSMMKRGYDGVYHHISEDHLYRYVNEFADRHNIRNMNTVEMMGAMAERMVGSRLRYMDLIDDGVYAGRLKEARMV